MKPTNFVAGINDCLPGSDDIWRAAEIIAAVGQPTLELQCMYPFPNSNFSNQSVVRSVHTGGAFCALADGSVRFVSDFTDGGSFTGSHVPVVYNRQFPDSFLTWQRLCLSADSLPITGDF